MRRFARWWRWEMGRTIEVTTVIRLITIERFLKFVVLVGGGVALLVVGERGGLHDFVTRVQTDYNLADGRGVFARLVRYVVARVQNVSTRRVVEIAVAAMLYGLLEGAEGVGLLLRRRWAEYLVLVATAAFLPVEIREIAIKPSFSKVLALLVNVLIVVYLVWRKRLFLERPGHAASEGEQPD